MALTGLTCVMVGTLAFPIASTWKNSYSITFLPVGLILLAGSAFIKWRLAVVLLFPAGFIGLTVCVMAWRGAPEKAPQMQYVLPTIISAALVLAGIGANVPALIRAGTRRRGLAGANVFAMCLLALTLAVAANFMASKYYRKRDLTQSGRFTLAPKTLEVIAALDEPVKMTFVMPETSRGDEYPFVHKFAKLMIEDYARLSDKLTLEYLDPDGERTKALAFFKEGGFDRAYSVVFETSHATIQVLYGKLFEIDRQAMYRGADTTPKFKGETEFTAALIKVTADRKDVIYFTTGKGEKPIQAAGRRAPFMSILAQKIKYDNYEPKQINIAAQGIPADCDILAIIGPKKPFSQQEIDAISDFLDNPDKPGKLLVALDPIIEQVLPCGLEELLFRWGIFVRQDITAVSGPPTIAKIVGQLSVHANHPPHQITEKMGTVSARFDVACMVAPVSAPPGQQGQQPYDVAPIAQTPKEGWGETDLSGDMKYDPGIDPPARPLPIAVCSEQRHPNVSAPNPYGSPPKPDPDFSGTRIVVVGDADFLTNIGIMTNSGNIDFALNCINWLAHKTTRLGITAKPLLPPPIRVSAGEMTAIFYSTLIGLPYLALVIGGIVYWRRSR